MVPQIQYLLLHHHMDMLLMIELDLINQQEPPQALLQVAQKAQEKYTMLQQ